MPPATTASNEAQLLLAIQRITFIEREIEDNKREAERETQRAELRIKALEDERNRAFVWGISTLGIAVVGMGTWIFNLVTGGHIK